MPKILTRNVLQESQLKENKNGILAVFRKDIKKKRNLIEKELYKLRKPKDDLDSSENLKKINAKKYTNEISNDKFSDPIKENKRKEKNASEQVNENSPSSASKNLRKNKSKTQSINGTIKKKLIFSTEFIEDNEFPQVFRVSNNNQSNIFSKNISSQNGELISSVEIPHMRMRRNKIDNNPKWYLQNNIPVMSMLPQLVNDLQFQSNSINDEVKVLYSDIHKFRTKLMQDPNMLRAFRAQDIRVQTNFNLILEESYMLLMEITKLLIDDFVKFLENIIDIRPPNLNAVNFKPITKEINGLIQNANLFNEVSEYFLNCYEVYNTLIKQVDNMVLRYKDFIMVLQFFSRCRMNVSKLTYYCDNYVNNYMKDKDLMSKYLSKYNKHQVISSKKSKFLDVHKVDGIKKKMKDLNNVLKT